MTPYANVEGTVAGARARRRDHAKPGGEAHARANAIDLNLLTYFEALISERQVSRAAKLVNLSQPAMSLALKRLRELFDDPLVIRTPEGMVPTSRAQELIGPVREMLRQSQDLLSPRRNVSLAEATGPLVFMGTDFVSTLVMPRLINRVRELAPRAEIVIRSSNPERMKRWFDDGKVDIGIGYCTMAPAKSRMRTLFNEPLVCIARRGHPQIDGEITLDQFCTLPQVQIQPGGEPRYSLILRKALSQHGRDIQPGVSVYDFLPAPEIVAHSDMIAVVPERMARYAAERGPIQVLRLPIEALQVPISMMWHERTHREPVYRALRDLVVEHCGAL
jgi:DNA-binding transcriptional LysR family regulator